MIHKPLIALGTWSWGIGAIGGDQIFGNNFNTESLQPVVDAAIKGGLNLFDTAVAYGMGSSETILGDFVKQYPRNQILISTKFTPQLAAQYNNSIKEMLESSLERLGVDYIDIYWIHNPLDVSKWTPQLIPLLKSGKVKSVGVSNHNLDEIKLANGTLSAEGFKISAVQNHFSLLYRSSEDAGIIDYCKENDITFFSYMVLEQGALSGKYNVNNPLPEGSGRANTYNKVLPQLEELLSVMKKIGERKNASVAQVAIAWAISKNTLPIIGVTKVAQVQDALNATKITLNRQEIEELELLAAKTAIDTKASWEKPMI